MIELTDEQWARILKLLGKAKKTKADYEKLKKEKGK